MNPAPLFAGRLAPAAALATPASDAQAAPDDDVRPAPVPPAALRDIDFTVACAENPALRHAIAQRRLIRRAALGAVLSMPLLAFAQSAGGGGATGGSGGIPAFIALPSANGGTSYSLPIQTVIVLTALTFLPAILLLMTSFTRIIIVLSLLRQAMGLSTTPPNQVLIGLSLFLTLFVMSPVLNRAYEDAYKPFAAGTMPFEEAVTRGVQPFRQFMLRQTREADLALFAKISHAAPMNTPADVPLSLLVPAFATSELKTGFQIGFTIFIPFLIVDLVVASVLMAMGMMMVSPATISLPFKLMLFVLVDGWQLIIGSLAQSFYQ